MSDLPLGFAYGAGTVAAFNPCGFALLPAYLSVFLTGGEAAPSAPRALRRAAVVATSVAVGFAAVFGIAGLLISQTSVTVQRWTPWLSVIIGIALIPVGIAMMRGWSPKLRLPAVRRAARAGAAGGAAGPVDMFWFGVSYATVSLSCTIPAFLVSVVGTFGSASAWEGMAVFLAYTAGMASVLVVLTVAVALARQGLIGAVRRVLPWVNALAGALAAVAGAYVAYYGFYELRLERGGTPPDWPLTIVGDASGAATRWVAGLGTLGVVLAVAASAAVSVLVTLVRRARATRSAKSTQSGSAPTPPL